MTNSRINHWTSKEVDLLKKIYPFYSNVELERMLGHPKNSVSNKAIELGLKKQRWWTSEEAQLLKEYYPLMGSSEFRESFMVYRSVSAIRKKAHELKVSLNDDVALKIRDENLKGRLTVSLENHPDFTNTKDLRCTARNRVLKWRREVLKYYEGKCILTGDTEDVVVHHVYPFSKIFNYTLNKYENNLGFIRDDDLKKCIDINGGELVELFLNDVYDSHKISQGVVIKKDLHDLFHSIYGTYYFTRDDFYSFIDDYKNGSLKGGGTS